MAFLTVGLFSSCPPVRYNLLPDLTVVIEAWDRLPEAIRAVILAMVNSAAEMMLRDLRTATACRCRSEVQPSSISSSR